jgi:hypothetical protein
LSAVRDSAGTRPWKALFLANDLPEQMHPLLFDY